MSDWKKYMKQSDAYAASLCKKSHKVYDVDPYVMVFEDEDVPGVFHIYYDAHSKGASAWMHLIVGQERALLIDTAFGIGDLRGLVETLTDKPVDVVNTHFHGDHSAGNGQFETIFIHKYDIPYLEMSERQRTDYCLHREHTVRRTLFLCGLRSMSRWRTVLFSVSARDMKWK